MIPVNEPVLGERELTYVTECVRTGWVSSAGRFLTAFEEAWASYCGRRHGIAVCNGTVALELAVAALDLQPGDEVILPTFTIISCALAVVRRGCVPVLVDVDPRTWCLDLNQVRDKITPRTRAVMPVHMYGHPVDMDALLEITGQHGLKVIEDAAEVHGAEYLSGRRGPAPTWRRCGSFGDLSSFSFYGNKLVTTGEGGMVLTDDSRLAERCRWFRNLCFEPEKRFYHHELGYNFHMTNVQAALGLAQVERMDQIVAHKRWMGQTYTERLQNLPHIQLQAEEPWARSVFWMYGLVLAEETGMDATQFARRLHQRGVETRPFFLGMHEQPVFHKRGLFRDERYPVSERLARQGLYLPSGMALTAGQVTEVCAVVEEVLRG